MRNIVIVDASVALKWVIDEPDSDQALALLDEWTDKGTVMFAPPLLVYEVANILYQNVRRGEMTVSRAQQALQDVVLSGIEFDFLRDATLATRAIKLAHTYKLKSAYDAQYLALAEREGCELWTSDTKLWRAVEGKILWVRRLADYPAIQNGYAEEE